MKASNNDGVWNEDGASLRIIIPPWWKTWWFKILTVLSVITLAYTYYWSRINSIKKQNNKWQKLVAESTSELRISNAQLFTRQEEINTQNEELVAANDELMERQEEIAMQRDLLTEQNQKMLEAKQTIEQQNNEIILHNQILDKQVKERTYELVEYNQQLEQFAFITAHNLRAPLARILGLGQVLKLGQLTKEETQSVTEKMSFTAEELDHVTKDSNVCDVTGKVIRIIAKTVDVTSGNGKSIIGVTQKTAVSNPKKGTL